MKRRTLVLTLTALLLAAPSQAAELEARLDRQQIAPGETVTLLLRLHDGDEAPDVSPLGADFEILDVRQGSRTSIVNGRRSASFDWQLTLAPRRSGTLDIPALQAGAARSAPLVLEVAAGAGPAPGGAQPGGEPALAGAPVRVEASVDDSEPYVQGSVLLTARVVMDASVREGTLAAPVIEGAVVEPAGEDRQYTALSDGREVTVVERQYAVFPQRSGDLHIPPLVFDGRARANGATRRSDPFANFFGGSMFDAFGGAFAGGPGGGGSLVEEFFGGGGRAVRATSEPLTLAVQPRPEGVAGQWWLPARHVELIEEWDTQPPVFRVGEPVNRRIAIRATGLSGAQLPALALPEIDGIKQYDEPPLDDTVSQGDEIVAVKLQQTALVPTRAGTLELPAVELGWWNTDTDTAQTATLPARSISVLPASGGVAAGAPPASAQPVSEVGVSEVGGGAAPAAAAMSAEPGETRGLPTRWGSPGWVGAGLGALALGLTVAIALIRRRRNAGSASPGRRRGPQPDVRGAEAALRRACRGHDAAAARASLRQLARARWPVAPPSGPVGWGLRLASPALASEIEKLDRSLYASQRPARDAGDSGDSTDEAAAWSGAELWAAYREAATNSKRSAARAHEPLPRLYPAA